MRLQFMTLTRPVPVASRVPVVPVGSKYDISDSSDLIGNCTTIAEIFVKNNTSWFIESYVELRCRYAYL